MPYVVPPSSRHGTSLRICILQINSHAILKQALVLATASCSSNGAEVLCAYYSRGGWRSGTLKIIPVLMFCCHSKLLLAGLRDLSHGISTTILRRLHGHDERGLMLQVPFGYRSRVSMKMISSRRIFQGRYTCPTPQVTVQQDELRRITDMMDDSQDTENSVPSASRPRAKVQGGGCIERFKCAQLERCIVRYEAGKVWGERNYPTDLIIEIRMLVSVPSKTNRFYAMSFFVVVNDL